MERVGYFNGEYGSLESIQIPMLDRSVFFGDGVYDATIVCDGVILYEDEHIARFYNSAELVRIDIPVSPDELRETLRGLVDRFSEPNGFLYWQATRGTAPRAHEFPQDVPANLMGYIVPKPREDLSVKTTFKIVEDTRFYHCNAKTLNLLPNVLAMQTAKDSGAEEAVFVRNGDEVTECAHSNVHILKDGVLITHPADNLILPGIARRHLLDMAKSLGVPVEERVFTPDEMMHADEIIMSASSTFARGVKEIDGQPVGGKDPELLSKLQTALTQEFEDYLAEHRS